MTKENFTYTITHPFTDEILHEYPAERITDDYGNKIIFSKARIFDKIDQVQNYYTEHEDSDLLDTNVTLKQLIAKCDIMREFVRNLDDDQLNKIIDCMPRYKNGAIRYASIPIYMSGIFHTTSGEGWSRKTQEELQISPFEFGTRTYIIDFDYRQYDKTDIPIINADGTYNKLEIKRNSYMKMDELIPGIVYKDAKDREFLYLGVIKWASASKYGSIFTQSDETDDTKTLNIDDLKDTPYVFLKLSTKTKSELKSADSFESWFRQTIIKQISKSNGEDLVSTPTIGYSLKISTAFKVTEPVEQLFDLSSMYFTVDETVDRSDEYTLKEGSVCRIAEREIFAIIKKRAVRQYTVYTCGWNMSREAEDKVNKNRLVTYNKSEATAYLKNYLKENPDVKPYKYEDLFNVRTSFVYAHIREEVIAIDL